MVKVQNGWEKQSLEELEEQTSQQGSPISTISRSNGPRPTFDSPLGTDRARRPSGVSINSDHNMRSPHHSTPSDPSRSLATTPPGMSPYIKTPQCTHTNRLSILATRHESYHERCRQSHHSYRLKRRTNARPSSRPQCTKKASIQRLIPSTSTSRIESKKILQRS